MLLKPLLAAALLALLPVAAHAENQHVGAWMVRAGEDACVMDMQSFDGLTRQMLFVRRSEPTKVSLVIVNPGWQALAQQARVSIALSINGEAKLPEQVEVVNFGGYHGFAVPFSAQSMAGLIRTGANIEVRYQGATVWQVGAAGWDYAERAFPLLLSCAGGSDDPFRK